MKKLALIAMLFATPVSANGFHGGGFHGGGFHGGGFHGGGFHYGGFHGSHGYGGFRGYQGRSVGYNYHHAVATMVIIAVTGVGAVATMTAAIMMGVPMTAPSRLAWRWGSSEAFSVVFQGIELVFAR